MDLTTTTNRTNIQRLADYINSQANPELFAATLLAFAKPRRDDLAYPEQKTEVRIR